MSYKNSIDLLPKELIEQIQEYVDGKVIYIPKKQENKKHWGENTDTKRLLAIRNWQIYTDFENGITIPQLAKKYFLAEKSIQKILKEKKR
jgi:Mor family transcriptional regulator